MKDGNPRLILWVLLLQEFELQIIIRKGENNPFGNLVSSVEGIPNDPIPLNSQAKALM